MKYVYYSNYLEHHGIKGQKWGVRRFQESDGDWTEDGLARRRKGEGRKLKSTEQLKKDYPNLKLNYTVKDMDPNNPTHQQAYDSWTRLDGDIRDLSYDWYHSKPESETMKAIYKPIKDMDDAFNRKYDEVVEKYPMKYQDEQKLRKDSKSLNPLKARDANKKIEENKEVYRKRNKEINDYIESYKKEHPELFWQDNETTISSMIGTEKSSVEDLIGEEKMLGIILNDIGYEDTKEGRDFIRDVVMWD